jgi:hypothetical protein
VLLHRDFLVWENGFLFALSARRLNQRQDAGPDCFGQRGPRVDERDQRWVGIRFSQVECAAFCAALG